MRTRSIAAVFVVALLVGSLASCSKKDSGSDESSSESTEQTQRSTTTEETSRGAGSDSGSDRAGSGDSGSIDGVTDLLGDCGEAYILYSSLLASSLGFMGGATEEQLEELQQQADRLRDDVPEDLRDDMATVADAFEDFGAALSEGGILGSEAQRAAEKLDSPEVTAAMENLEVYFDSCQP